MRWGSDDRGSAAVELAILAVPAVLLLAVLAGAFRVWSATDRMSGVAGSAARDASIARDPATANTIATASAKAALLDANFKCTNITVNVDTSGFAVLPAPATIHVQVACTVTLSDLGLPGVPGNKVLTDDAYSPLDQARSLG